MKNPLMSLDDALAHLAQAAVAHAITDTESVSLEQALGRVLAHDVQALVHVPGADNSAMDGYALRGADLAQAPRNADGHPVLPVSQRIAAGQAPQALQPGTAARIFTGAWIPAGADAVVMQEHTALVAGDVPQVVFQQAVTPGQNIRRQGEDVRLGHTVLAAGTRLTPQALGLAASVGQGKLTVRRRPRVALLTTGDELFSPCVQPTQLPPGAVYNSNGPTLRALLETLGCDVTDAGQVPDQLAATRAALRRVADDHDLVISSGGVSVGEEDHLRAALQAEGELALWALAIKPGKPLAFGQIRAGTAGGRDTLYLGLPGNPVSALVTFVLAARTVLRGLQGQSTALPMAWPLRADFDWAKADKRREFLRARLNAEGGLTLFANQGSGVLTSAHWADGLIDNPPGAVITRGQTVAFWPWASLLS